MPMTVHIRHPKLRRESIVRAVASSTAIETGQRIADIEAQLLGDKRRFTHLSLALKPAPRPVRG